MEICMSTKIVWNKYSTVFMEAWTWPGAINYNYKYPLALSQNIKLLKSSFLPLQITGARRKMILCSFSILTFLAIFISWRTLWLIILNFLMYLCIPDSSLCFGLILKLTTRSYIPGFPLCFGLLKPTHSNYYMMGSS